MLRTPPEGKYLLGDSLGQGGIFSHAIDPAAAEKLWMPSEALTGISLAQPRKPPPTTTTSPLT